MDHKNIQNIIRKVKEAALPPSHLFLQGSGSKLSIGTCWASALPQYHFCATETEMPDKDSKGERVYLDSQFHRVYLLWLRSHGRPAQCTEVEALHAMVDQ